jgi:hypothetical protein
MNPNGYDCGFCEMWDDVNECWANKKNIIFCEAYNRYIQENEDTDYINEEEHNDTKM